MTNITNEICYCLRPIALPYKHFKVKLSKGQGGASFPFPFVKAITQPSDNKLYKHAPVNCSVQIVYDIKSRKVHFNRK